MKPFRKVLVPVDYSPTSNEALSCAVEIARRYEAELGVVYVYQPTTYAVPDSFELFTPSQLAAMESEFQRRLDTTKSELMALGCRNVDAKLLTGAPATEIVNHAEAWSYDLIVMGTHGRTGVAHALMGSVAEKVVRKAPCAVLTVRLPKSAQA